METVFVSDIFPQKFEANFLITRVVIISAKQNRRRNKLVRSYVADGCGSYIPYAAGPGDAEITCTASEPGSLQRERGCDV